MRALLEHENTDPDALTDWEDSALHLAIRGGHLATVTALLAPRPDGKQLKLSGRNKSGRTPLLILAYNAKENAALILEALRAAQPNLCLDEADPDGNTPLLVAYLNGAAQLCAALVRAGAQIGAPNRQLDTIFTVETPTKQLLFKLLGKLDKSRLVLFLRVKLRVTDGWSFLQTSLRRNRPGLMPISV